MLSDLQAKNGSSLGHIDELSHRFKKLLKIFGVTKKSFALKLFPCIRSVMSDVSLLASVLLMPIVHLVLSPTSLPWISLK